MKTLPAQFEGSNIRRVYDEKTETWFFSVVDIIQVLTQQTNYQTARKYWNKLKERLRKEGNQSVTNCHRLKLIASDGKGYLTDIANVETILRLVQSVPSPKAEPIKLRRPVLNWSMRRVGKLSRAGIICRGLSPGGLPI